MALERLERAAEALRRRGYEAAAVASSAEAKALVLAEAKGAASIAWGGSETLKETGIRAAIAKARERRAAKQDVKARKEGGNEHA